MKKIEIKCLSASARTLLLKVTPLTCSNPTQKPAHEWNDDLVTVETLALISSSSLATCSLYLKSKPAN